MSGEIKSYARNKSSITKMCRDTHVILGNIEIGRQKEKNTFFASEKSHKIFFSFNKLICQISV